VNEPRLDPERLAALLDGTLDPQAREALLAALGDADEARETLADAAALLADMEAAGEIPDDLALPPHVRPAVVLAAAAPPEAGVVAPATPPPEAIVAPIDVRPLPVRRPRTRRWTGLLAAAAVVGAVGLGLYQRSAGAAFDDPGAIVALLPAAAAGGPAPWSVTRGAGAEVAARTAAIRFGARAVDLALAVRGRDTVAVQSLAGETAALLDGVTGAVTIAQLYRQAADHPAAPPATLAPTLHDAFTAGMELLGEADVRAGAWLGGARAAAAVRDADFFRQRASRRQVDALAARSDLDAETRGAADRLRAVSDGGAAPDWDAVTRDVGALLAALGR